MYMLHKENLTCVSAVCELTCNIHVVFMSKMSLSEHSKIFLAILGPVENGDNFLHL